ncbi:MAG: AraC family transcriptional regulator [Bacteroidaceae bacterium]|nr:AraC family transcriptional regulator [Bacteroidaceae bacterium]
MTQDTIPTIALEKELMVIRWPQASDTFEPKRDSFRLANGAFLLGLRGKLSLSMNLIQYDVTAHTLLTIIPHHIVQGYDISDDFEGYLILFTPALAGDINLWRSNLPFMTEMRYNPLVTLQRPECDLFTSFCEFFYKVEGNDLIDSSPEIRKSMLTALLHTLGALYRRQIPLSISEKQTRANLTFRKFLSLLVTHYAQERSVTFYANALCITPKYLGTICREVSSKLATDIIASAVILDAKAKLHNTDLTVQEISHSLNFANPSFFGRYFKRHTGYSPMQYREGK